jgi:hypothetical protein
MPFIVRREKGDWHVDSLPLSGGEVSQHIKNARLQDPYALLLNTRDLISADASDIYKTILTARFYAEYDAIPPNAVNRDETYALLLLLENNIGALSLDTTEYIALYDNPLAALREFVPASVTSGAPNIRYDKNMVDETIKAIESTINDLLVKRRLHSPKLETEKAKKFNIKGFEETLRLQLAERFVVLAENYSAGYPYLVFDIEKGNEFGETEYYNSDSYSDYLKAVRGFIGRAEGLLSEIESTRANIGIPFETLTVVDCLRDGNETDWDGKLVIIRPEVLSMEYRSAEHQLAFCIGGDGAKAGAFLADVHLKELYSGKESYYKRFQIAGIADPARLPAWAAAKFKEERFAECQGSIPAQTDENSNARPARQTLQEKLDNAKEKAREADAQKGRRGDNPIKRNGPEVS